MTNDVVEEKIQIPEVKGANHDTFEIIDFISSGEQYLTFYLARELYAVDILNVTEIRGWDSPTRLPNSPDYIKGVVNIRGIVIPIIDLRILFQLGEPEYLGTTVVIVLAVQGPSMSRTMGFVVDAVSDVLDVEGSKIKKAPSIAGSIDTKFIKGCVNLGREVVTLLDVHHMIRLDREA